MSGTRSGPPEGLAAVQVVLARLCAEPALRKAFLADPVGTGQKQLGLAPADAELCARLAGAEVDRFARSLLGKRRMEAAKLVPRTAALLEDRFRDLFRRYAEAHPRPEQRTRYGDALGFCTWLLRQPPEEWCAGDSMPAREVCRYEQAWLMVNDRWCRTPNRWSLHVKLFRAPMRQVLLRSTGDGSAPPAGRQGRGWSLGLWLLRGPRRWPWHRLLP